MRQPKPLTLQEAIQTTQKPLARFGDLRAVQVFPQLNGHRDFPNGEMLAIFLPHSTNWAQIGFLQPETERYLRDELYANGGRIESLVRLSDKELALTYGGYAGIMRPSGVVGDAGDPSEFERAYLDAIARLPENHPPEWRSIIRETLLEAHRQLAPDAERGRAHTSRQTANAARKRPVKNEVGQTLAGVIAMIGREHPESGPNEIWPHLRSAIEEWSGDAVSESGDTYDGRRYQFMRGDVPDSITFGIFRRKLKESRITATGV
jgi:hypothetical protein